jgi:hypothetical protein
MGRPERLLWALLVLVATLATGEFGYRRAMARKRAREAEERR